MPDWTAQGMKLLVACDPPQSLVAVDKALAREGREKLVTEAAAVQDDSPAVCLPGHTGVCRATQEPWCGHDGPQCLTINCGALPPEESKESTGSSVITSNLD